MRSSLLCLMAGAGFAFGCSSGPTPETSQPPPAAGDQGFPRIVEGASDSVGSVPGSPGAPYIFRFRLIDPGGERFAFRDRDLSFYFKPAPDALHFQIENLQNRPVWIDWERSIFYDPNSGSGKVAHMTTTWDDRFRSQPNSQISGLQRYSDYVFPLSYLLDPVASSQQLHRQLLPEDDTSPQYVDRVFGVDLVFLIEDRPRTYPFRFKVVSVIPR